MKFRDRIWQSLTLCAVTAMLALPARAAETTAEEDPSKQLLSHDLVMAGLTIAVFVVLLIVLRAAAWKPILGALKGRENAIRDSIEAAGKAKEEADRTTRELEAKIAEAQKQAAAQITQAKADATKVAEVIKKQAETESTQLKDRTLRDIEAAKQQALAEINSHAAALGTAIASKILQRQVTVTDQDRLVDESLAQLGQASKN
jgi:F-type H+-transporting ATPase subunit b